MSKISEIFSADQLAQLDKAFDELSRAKNNWKPEIELKVGYSIAGIDTLYIQMGNGARIHMDIMPKAKALLKEGVLRMHPIVPAPVYPTVVENVRILLNSGHHNKDAKRQSYVEKEMGWTMQAFKDKLNALVFFSSAG